ncbi:MAG: phosphoenolpyruvate carboxykinase (ATP), partial [Myxococcota bacterium]
MTFSLSKYDIDVKKVYRNAAPAFLYEQGLKYEAGSQISSSGALVALSGEKTGRSPTDKRIVKQEGTQDDVWWGPVNMAVDDHTFAINRERALDYLNTRERLYVVDGYGGWDETYRIKVRIVTTRAYHALF